MWLPKLDFVDFVLSTEWTFVLSICLFALTKLEKKNFLFPHHLKSLIWKLFQGCSGDVYQK